MPTRKLSKGRSRSDIISTFHFGMAAAATEVPPAPVATADPDAAAEDPVTKAINALDAAVQEATQAQAGDPDAATDPDDAPVSADLSKIADLVDDLKKAQAKDTADEPAAEEPDPNAPTLAAAGAVAPVPAPAGKDTGAPAEVDKDTDENGDVAAHVKCSNADCGHLAAAHQDQETGANSGACTMQGCSCEGFTTSTKPMADEDDGSGGGNGDADPANTLNDQTAAQGVQALADGAPVTPVAGGPTDAAPAVEPELNLPPEMPGGDSMGPAFTIPVGVIMGQPTGDGRSIAPDALDWRIPPMPLMGLDTATHDPSGMDQNDPAVICGRIDSLSIDPGENGTQVVSAKGFYLPNDDGMHFAEMTEAMGRCGISADIAVDETEVTGDLDEDGWPTAISETLTKGTIMGFTQCPFPAFQGAYIVLGDGAAQPSAIPQAAEENPVPEAVAAGGQLLHLMTYKECEPCAQGLEVITAAGGPVAPPKAWFENPGFTLGDERLMELAETRGKRKYGGSFACPITVTEDGRIFGHLAPWGVCHTGVTGQCITAPHSKDGYAHFKRGQHVITAEGESVRVGVITAGVGHASTRGGISASQAMAHYDNTALAVADVNVGEDDFGIWVAGAIRPEATDEQVRMLRASSLSGDWRNMGGGLELVAALCVNQPGFPLAVVASGQVDSLVASGAGAMHRLANPAADETLIADGGDSALRKALAPMLGQAKSLARDRISSIR